MNNLFILMISFKISLNFLSAADFPNISAVDLPKHFTTNVKVTDLNKNIQSFFQPTIIRINEPFLKELGVTNLRSVGITATSFNVLARRDFSKRTMDGLNPEDVIADLFDAMRRKEISLFLNCYTESSATDIMKSFKINEAKFWSRWDRIKEIKPFFSVITIDGNYVVFCTIDGRGDGKLLVPLQLCFEKGKIKICYKNSEGNMVGSLMCAYSFGSQAINFINAPSVIFPISK